MLAVAFLLVLHVFLKIFLFKTIPQIAFASGTFISMTSVLLFIYYSFKEPSFLKKRIVWIYLGFILITLLYLILLAIFQGYAPFQHVYFVRNYFWNFLLFMIFVSIPQKKRLNLPFFIQVIFALTVIMALLCLLQYLVPGISEFFKIYESIRFGEIRSLLGETISKQKIVSGTFNSPQVVASFMLLNVIFLLVLKTSKIVDVSRHIYIIVGFGIFTMLLAGVRSPIMGLFVGFVLIASSKSWLLSLGIAFTAFLIGPLLVQFFKDAIIAATTFGYYTFEAPLERLFGVLAIFDNTAIYRTTFSRTLNLLEYVWSNPLFGAGTGIVYSNYSRTDAFMILHIIEFGIVGFLLLLLPYIYTLWMLKTKCHSMVFWISLVVFGTALSQSVVNEGLWTQSTNIQFFFMVMLLFRLDSHSRLLHSASFVRKT